MAPEYAYHGQFSIKSDVFSFGVLILEIISGQKNNCFRDRENTEDLLSFVSIYISTKVQKPTFFFLIHINIIWIDGGTYVLQAWKNWRDGTPENVIDTIVLSSGSRTEMIRCIHIGLLCVQENAADRPTMASVVLMLNSFSLTLSLPTRPAFFLQSNNISSNENHSPTAPLQANSSQNGASISDIYPR